LNIFRNEIVDRLLPIVVFLEVFWGLWCSSFVAFLSDKHNGERAAALVFRLAEEERAALEFGIPLGFGFGRCLLIVVVVVVEEEDDAAAAASLLLIADAALDDPGSSNEGFGFGSLVSFDMGFKSNSSSSFLSSSNEFRRRVERRGARGLVACLEGEETFALKEFLAAKSTKGKKMVTTKPKETKKKKKTEKKARRRDDLLLFLCRRL
jgi:hypothetical protein